MKSIQIFDKPMCCSTGVCGPQVDPVLPRFAADLQWLETQGVQVERYNLAQEPAKFAANPLVQQVLASEGVECLPVILVNGQIATTSEYPTRETLGTWLGLGRQSDPLAVFNGDSDCCGGSGCC